MSASEAALVAKVPVPLFDLFSLKDGDIGEDTRKIFSDAASLLLRVHNDADFRYHVLSTCKQFKTQYSAASVLGGIFETLIKICVAGHVESVRAPYPSLTVEIDAADKTTIESITKEDSGIYSVEINVKYQQKVGNSDAWPYSARTVYDILELLRFLSGTPELDIIYNAVVNAIYTALKDGENKLLREDIKKCLEAIVVASFALRRLQSQLVTGTILPHMFDAKQPATTVDVPRIPSLSLFPATDDLMREIVSDVKGPLDVYRIYEKFVTDMHNTVFGVHTLSKLLYLDQAGQDEIDGNSTFFTQKKDFQEKLGKDAEFTSTLSAYISSAWDNILSLIDGGGGGGDISGHDLAQILFDVKQRKLLPSKKKADEFMLWRPFDLVENAPQAISGDNKKNLVKYRIALNLHKGIICHDTMLRIVSSMIHLADIKTKYLDEEEEKTNGSGSHTLTGQFKEYVEQCGGIAANMVNHLMPVDPAETWKEFLQMSRGGKPTTVSNDIPVFEKYLKQVWGTLDPQMVDADENRRRLRDLFLLELPAYADGTLILPTHKKTLEDIQEILGVHLFGSINVVDLYAEAELLYVYVDQWASMSELIKEKISQNKADMNMERISVLLALHAIAEHMSSDLAQKMEVQRSIVFNMWHPKDIYMLDAYVSMFPGVFASNGDGSAETSADQKDDWFYQERNAALLMLVEY